MNKTHATAFKDTASESVPTYISVLEVHPINFLSFGPSTEPIELKQLNVLIGPNGSGKSNFLEAISMMRATPVDVGPVIREGGGTAEWIWKGAKDKPASVSIVVPFPGGPQPLRHRFDFSDLNQSFHLVDEVIEYQRPDIGYQIPYWHYQFRGGRPQIKSKSTDLDRTLLSETLDRNTSILAQLRDPEEYPAITELADQYGQIKMFREWSFGRNSALRERPKTGYRNDKLEESCINLGQFLQNVRLNFNAKKEIVEGLKAFYDGFDDYEVSFAGGTTEIFFQENQFNVSATRLSDGTLRYLCLLAILCDPKPPRLICIEEPELGLHPDIIPTLAKLLLKASERTQLIITTHSDILIDALSEHPEYVMVCEKHEGQTQIKRLDPDNLKVWLEKYSLGEIWTSGHLGGNRW